MTWNLTSLLASFSSSGRAWSRQHGSLPANESNFVSNGGPQRRCYVSEASGLGREHFEWRASCFGTVARPLVSQSPRSLDEPWVRKWKRCLWPGVSALFLVICAASSGPVCFLGRAVALSLGVFRRYRFSPLDRRDPSRVFTVFELVATPVLGLGGRLTVMFGADSRGSACSRRSLPGLGRRFYRIGTKAIWLILPVVICLSQRFSQASVSTSLNKVKPQRVH